MDRSANLRERAISLKEVTFRELWALLTENSSILKEIDPIKRRKWLQTIIDELYDRQQGLCGLCKKPMQKGVYEVDHKIPFAYGGGNERTNIQLAHPTCNREKKATVAPCDLLRYLEDRYVNL